MLHVYGQSRCRYSTCVYCVSKMNILNADKYNEIMEYSITAVASYIRQDLVGIPVGHAMALGKFSIGKHLVCYTMALPAIRELMAANFCICQTTELNSTPCNFYLTPY